MVADQAASQRVVVVTGAAGGIGRAVLPLLPRTWHVRATDLVTSEDVARLDVSDQHACRSAFSGADAVVHLAAVPDPHAAWDELLPANVVGVHAVAQAAMGAGVRRLVLASSLQAVSAVAAGTQRRAGDPPRPANLYGATKAWAEAVGSWVAATSSTSVVALRIGSFKIERPHPDTTSAGSRAACLSPRDAAELIRAAVEADVTGLVVANGISANRYRQADLETTTRALGYRPTDDPWERAGPHAPLGSHELATQQKALASQSHSNQAVEMTDRAATEDEEALTGGNMGGATRIGDSVHRTPGPWTPSIQRLLTHLRQQDLTWVPEPRGVDEQGRDKLSYLPGLVPQHPLPAWIWSEQILVDAAVMMAELHKATEDFRSEGAIWQLPTHQPAEVFCHNDFAPCNMVFSNERLSGVIDWDTASPGPRVWDLAYLAYRLVPLNELTVDDGLVISLEDRAQRLHLLCRSYGPTLTTAEVVAMAVQRLHELADFTQARADEGLEHLRSHADLYRRDASWIEERADALGES